MPITTSNPIDQITGLMGTLKPITLADVFNDDHESDELQGDLDMKSMSEALKGLEVADCGSEIQEDPPRMTEAVITESKELPSTIPDAHISDTSLQESGEKVDINPISSSSTTLSSSLLSSSSFSCPSLSPSSSCSSSSDELPSTLESKRRYCIGAGVYSLSETLKLGKVGRVERPTIYHHPQNKDGSYSENLIPVKNIGDVPSDDEIRAALSSASPPAVISDENTMRTRDVRYTSPMTASLLQSGPFEPQGALHNGNNAYSNTHRRSQWHEPSTYRSRMEDDEAQYQEHRPNFAPFRTNRRFAAQRAQMQPQAAWNHQKQMGRSDAGPYHTQPRSDLQWQGRYYGHGSGQWQEEQRQPSQWQGHYQQQLMYQDHACQEVPQPSQLPPHVSLYGLLPNQAYDMPLSPPPPPAVPYRHLDNVPFQHHHYERGEQRLYDPAPHQAHWRGDNMYARAELPLTWKVGGGGGQQFARGANAIPLGSRSQSRYPPHQSDADDTPEVWRRDVDLVRKGILHRTHRLTPWESKDGEEQIVHCIQNLS